MLEPSQGLNHLPAELKREALKPENRRARLIESGANTFPPFQSYFCLSPSACFPCRGLVYFLCPSRVQSLSECICFREPPFTLKGLNRPFSGLSTFPGSPHGKSLLEFCSRPTLVSSARCCSHRVISMTIVLGLSGGSVALILWGHFQAIKSFICVDLKESCEVPSAWNPLQQVSTALSGCRTERGRTSALPSRSNQGF